LHGVTARSKPIRPLGIENAAVQNPVPDPFTLPEVEAILDVSERQVSRLPAKAEATPGAANESQTTDRA